VTLRELTGVIVDAAVKVHTVLGPGLLERVYQLALAQELENRGLSVAQEVAIPVLYQGKELGDGFRADIIVEARVLLELKSVEKVAPVHKKQVLTYLRLTGLKVGLLLNFGAELMKNGIYRIANGVEDND
jgi:GxxExxY protein